jgi:hypothetical protein
MTEKIPAGVVLSAVRFASLPFGLIFADSAQASDVAENARTNITVRRASCHVIRKPVRPRFRDSGDRLSHCVWKTRRDLTENNARKATNRDHTWAEKKGDN